MKKNILGGVAVLAIAVAAAFTMTFNTYQGFMGELLLSEIEALAQSEVAVDCDGAPGKCTTGGRGASSCSLTYKIEAGGGSFSVGESVTANVSVFPGYFACCWATYKMGLVSGVFAKSYSDSCK